MPKNIVFSGHGGWEPAKDGFAAVPKNCQMNFYTDNLKSLSDALGGQLDVANITIDESQTQREFSSVPDYRLYPPTGLNIKTPDLTRDWHVIHVPFTQNTSCPADARNIQVIARGGAKKGLPLSLLFNILRPAVDSSSDGVLFIWACCRALQFQDAGGEALGVNVVQR
jgi:hypothetical protein